MDKPISQIVHISFGREKLLNLRLMIHCYDTRKPHKLNISYIITCLNMLFHAKLYPV